jgi:hypothetical protein
MGLGIKIPRNALSAGREAFQNNPNGGDNVQLDPGEYLGLIKGIKGVETAKGAQIVCDIAVGGEDVDSSIKGGTVSLWFSFEEERVVFLFKFLALLGYQDKIEDLEASDLDEIAAELPGRNVIVKFRATEKDGYTNIRLKKVMEDLTPDEIGLEENSVKKGKGKAKAKDEDETTDEDEDEPKAKAKAKGKGKAKAEAKDEDEDETVSDDDADESVEVKVGLIAKATIKGEERSVKVTKILAEEEKIIVQDLESDAKFKISPDRLG